MVRSNHSHVCGINSPRQIIPTGATESFPRMWDQPPEAMKMQMFRRIIPTYVGSTRRSGSLPLLQPNHSHVCGINACSASQNSTKSESFPRMWDQQDFSVLLFIEDRIIPTYVGSTLQIAFTLHQAIQHLVVLCYWRMVYDFLDPQYVLALNSS